MLTFLSPFFFDPPDRNCRLLHTNLLEPRMRWITLGPRGLRGVEGVRGRGDGGGRDAFFGFVLLARGLILCLDE